MAKGGGIDGNIILLGAAGAGVGAYFTDCLGYCIGFKTWVDTFIGSIIGTGTPPGGGGGCTADTDCATGQTCTAGVCTGGGGTVFQPCPAGQYRDVATNTCKTIPITCPTGQHWDQGGGACQADAPVGCGTPLTNPGYTCCTCKEAAGRDKCPQGICCAECMTQCPSQCKGFTSSYGRRRISRMTTSIGSGNFDRVIIT